MRSPDLTEADRAQLARAGISEEEAARQLRLLRNPPAPIRLLRPCTAGDGVVRLREDEHPELLALHEEAARAGRLTKLVPASGAASRMFQALAGLLSSAPEIAEAEARTRAAAGDKGAADLVKLVERLDDFAFAGDLDASLGGGLGELRRDGAWGRIAGAILENRLGYSEMPKGLILFHRYPPGPRAPFEEHLVEAAATVRDAEGMCRVHFTVAPEHEERFRERLEFVVARVLSGRAAGYKVDFSTQSPATDTLAIDAEGSPFRLDDGTLLLRPGGHGALLSNLEALGGDVVLVKNIDNILHESRTGPTLLWKRLLTGYLVRLERQLRAAGDPRAARPLRVCGVVKNQGEPGGGPFWVRDSGDGESAQIVESSQADLLDPAQKAIWDSSSHFNPVDLVCSVRDAGGRPHRLSDYVDEETVFLARKSKEGRALTALERPGLWNGAMARWTTAFVEVPVETFAPVKTVLDLLRPEHQPL